MEQWRILAAQQAEQLVEAEYADMKHAQQALNALEWAGVEAANITLSGPAAEDAALREDMHMRDLNMTKSVVLHAGAGVIAGAAIGGAIGGIAGLIAGVAFSTGMSTWFTAGIGMVIGVIGGLYAGGFIGGETALNINEAAEFKFDEGTQRPLPATVRVAVNSERSADRAETILQAKEPISVHRSFASDGRPVRR